MLKSLAHLLVAVVFIVIVAGLAPLQQASAQGSRCADCHLANPDAPGHLYAWERSPHGQNNVGCESCHGGDATTFDSFTAHRGILNSGNPSSPVNRKNIPRTCGTCHSGPYVAFQSSQMFALLEAGNPDVPVCTTCHSAVGAQLLSPKALEARCQKCHAADRPGSHPEFPAQGRNMLETIEEVRGLLRQAKLQISRIRDAELRQRFEEQYRQAEVPIIEALNFAHQFRYDASQERRLVSRQRAEALLDQLANTPPR
jgi:Cytochrome c554 and c-prime/Cytochrome c7 and related cytochrome c